MSHTGGVGNDSSTSRIKVENGDYNAGTRSEQDIVSIRTKTNQESYLGSMRKVAYRSRSW